MRLPKYINLGCGFTVKVEEVSEVSAQSNGADAWWLHLPEGSKHAGVISICKSLPYKQKRRLLMHELQHAITDINLKVFYEDN